ncbi:hypothetical protein DEO72_LG7g493 [Vigna unguiculata]|uniref:Uncharacterized protein n=1 Tax=Vigna unguiculata TaxID=3917 RepID=A0A4D6MCQ9_VIGUN|nr:hypothetical protein DEO72_LG7g493 [Vigna unguiculata]
MELVNYVEQRRDEVDIYVENIINETLNIEFVEFIEGGTSNGVEGEGVEIEEEGEVGVEGEGVEIDEGDAGVEGKSVEFHKEVGVDVESEDDLGERGEHGEVGEGANIDYQG